MLGLVKSHTKTRLGVVPPTKDHRSPHVGDLGVLRVSTGASMVLQPRYSPSQPVVGCVYLPTFLSKARHKRFRNTVTSFGALGPSDTLEPTEEVLVPRFLRPCVEDRVDRGSSLILRVLYNSRTWEEMGALRPFNLRRPLAGRALCEGKALKRGMMSGNRVY